MGARGPKPGTKYQKRVTIAAPVPIRSDGQLIEAQRLNDSIENVMERLEENLFPFDQLNQSNPRLTSRFRECVEAIQSAVLAGIEHYETHPVKSSPFREENFAFGSGRTVALGEE